MKDQAQRAHDVALAIGWQQPSFLPFLAYATFAESDEVDTLATDAKASIKVNPTYAASLPDVLLAGVVCHELLHPWMMHQHRQNGREHQLWNVCCDMVINQILRDLGVKLPEGLYYPPLGMEKAHAEEIYDYFQKNPEEKPEPKHGQVGKGCSCDSKAGDEGPGELGDGQTDGQLERQWKEVAAQAEAIAKGTAAAKVLTRAFRPPQPRVKWAQVLRSAVSRALAGHGRDDQTFTHPNRRSPKGVILPGWAATRARVAAVIDTSGSMSDQAVERCVAEVADIGRASGAKIYLVLHASEAYFAGWVDAIRPGEVGRRVTDRGGTRFAPAYEAVEAVKSFDAVVHLTDGEGEQPWPPKPKNCRRLIVAQIGDQPAQPPVGAQVIPVAL